MLDRISAITNARQYVLDARAALASARVHGRGTKTATRRLYRALDNLARVQDEVSDFLGVPVLKAERIERLLPNPFLAAA